MGNEVAPRFKKVAQIKEHTDTVTCLDFSPNGDYLATGSLDSRCIIWDVSSLKEPYSLSKKVEFEKVAVLSEHKESIRCLSYAPDNTKLVTGANDTVAIIWNVDPKDNRNFATFAFQLSGHKGSIIATSFSPDSKTLATGSEDKTCIVWSSFGKQLFSLASHTMAVSCIDFYHDGNILATGSWDQTIRFTHIDPTLKQNKFAKEILLINTGFPVTSISFGNNSKKIACSCEDKDVTIWNTSFHEKSKLLGTKIDTYTSHAYSVNSVKYSKEGSFLASGSDDKTTILWNVDESLPSQDTSNRKLILKDHHKGVTSVAFSSNGKVLASGSNDNTVIVYVEKEPKEVENGGERA